MPNWRDRLEAYVAGAKANEQQRTITVSKNVFDQGHKHDLRVLQSSEELTYAQVRSATSGSVYRVELWADEAEIFPTFPYVWKCSCRWGRLRFDPCSHVITVALYREKRYGESKD